MDQHIFVFITAIVIVVVIAVVIISWYNYRLKKRIIDSGPIDNEATNFLKKLTDTGAEPLKWGCVLFMAGLGFVVIQYLPDNTDSLHWGVLLMSIAAGFLIYYLVVTLKQKQ